MKRFALVSALAVLLVPGMGRAAGSLPVVSIGPRPGPAVLYEPLATAPQLENVNGWRTAPLMVSGTDAYDDGEYLYQDYIYDDHGANTTDLPLAPPDSAPASTATLFGGATGDVVYPTNAKVYGLNAADLLEFRARAVPSGVAYRITLNTMLDPFAAAVAIGIDSDRNGATGSNDWGFGLGSLGTLGLEHEIVVFGTKAFIDGGETTASVDITRNQIEVVAPFAPGTANWRHYLVTGINDPVTGKFAAIAENPTPSTPGGAHSTTAPPVFNVGFRFEESVGGVTVGGNPEHATNFGTRTVGFGHWRDHDQAKALAARDIARFHADIDFSELAGGIGLKPRPTGWINRLYVSHLDLGEGVKTTRPMLLGKIQPYGVYVPKTYQSGTSAPFHLLMHSLSCSYNQYAVFTPNQLEQLGEERGSFLMTPEGRGPDGWYHDEAEVDVFEAWADLAANYDLDPARTTLGGYSMGGYGTYKFASQYPDLFAKAFSVVGPADENLLGGPTAGAVESVNNNLRIADNMRNVPLLMWNGTNDELVPVAGVLRHERVLADLRYRHKTEIYPGYDHFLFSIVDQWGEAKEFLGQSSVDRNPEHVVYRAMPQMDVSKYDLVHDHAYWVSDVRVAAGASSGLVDARSEATTTGRPELIDPVEVGVRVNPPRGAWVALETQWNATTQVSRNALTIALTDVASATLWIERAGIDPTTTIEVRIDSNVPATVTLAGSFGTRTLTIPAGHSDLTV